MAKKWWKIRRMVAEFLFCNIGLDRELCFIRKMVLVLVVVCKQQVEKMTCFLHFYSHRKICVAKFCLNFAPFRRIGNVANSYIWVWNPNWVSNICPRRMWLILAPVSINHRTCLTYVRTYCQSPINTFVICIDWFCRRAVLWRVERADVAFLVKHKKPKPLPNLRLTSLIWPIIRCPTCCCCCWQANYFVNDIHLRAFHSTTTY